MKLMSKSRNLFLLFLILFCLMGCQKEKKKIEKDLFAFGTYFKIIAYTDNVEKTKKNIDLAFKEIERVDKRFNSKMQGSIIDNLNKNGEIEIDSEGIYLFNKVKEVYEMSDGMYDITMPPLLKAWGFEGDLKRESLPSKESLENAVKNVDFSKLHLEKNRVYFENKGMEIDTGSFLKGYAIERAKELLKKNGEKSILISAVSSIVAIGEKGNGKPWIIGIQNPDKPNDILGIVELRDKAMGVSGDYQTYVEIEGKRYHHILNKKTMYPEKSKKMVVVIADNCLDADLNSTAYFLMPLNKILNKTNKYEVLIVDSNNKIFRSQGINFIKK